MCEVRFKTKDETKQRIVRDKRKGKSTSQKDRKDTDIIKDLGSGGGNGEDGVMGNIQGQERKDQRHKKNNGTGGGILQSQSSGRIGRNQTMYSLGLCRGHTCAHSCWK